MTEVTIRPAREEDIPTITEIYNDAIRNTTATFDIIEKTVEDRRKWLAEHGEKHPVIVAVMDGKVAGWGSLSPYAERPGWRFTVENAVYVSPQYQGRGIGRRLLEELSRLAETLGYHAIIAQVVGGNEGSLRLHERCGFKTVGVLKEVGNKFGKWLDVIVMEKLSI
jgi:phosphinothricin acetyltransferase